MFQLSKKAVITLIKVQTFLRKVYVKSNLTHILHSDFGILILSATWLFKLDVIYIWHLMAKPCGGSLGSYATEGQNNPHSKETKGSMRA